MKTTIYLFVIAIFIGLSSCRISKKINKVINTPAKAVTTVAPEKIDSSIVYHQQLAKIKSNVINVQSFSAKIKVETNDDNGKNPDITANVRMIKDSAIWISLSATILGVEIYRALITPDSLFIIDKQKKEYMKRSLAYLQEVAQIPLDFANMQDILLGNPIFMGDSIQSFRSTANKMMLSTIGSSFKNLLTIQMPEGTLEHSKLDDVDLYRNRTANISYAKYEARDSILFSTEREISLAEKNKIDVKLSFKQFEFNKELSVNFNIPKNYKRK